MHFFTSITSNYIPKARVLAKSLKRHNPDAIFHLMLSDAVPQTLDLSLEPFDSIIRPCDLKIPLLDSWIFKHTVVELCTAVKGKAFAWIFANTQAEKVVYLDPDIVVMHELIELEEILDSFSIVLTPHLVVPETTQEAILDNEICSLQHGVYNLGFLALKKDDQGQNFLKWWADRLLEYCYDDIPHGLFTDQRWVDMAPCFFDNIRIIRDKTYNVATWNLSHREVTSDGYGKLYVEGRPIKFFHFSGFDSGAQAVMLAKYAREESPLFQLRDWYLERLTEEGQSMYGEMPNIYDVFSNGLAITKEHRLLYRMRNDLQKAFPDPAFVSGVSGCYLHWFEKQWHKEREYCVELASIAEIGHEKSLLFALAKKLNNLNLRRRFVQKSLSERMQGLLSFTIKR